MVASHLLPPAIDDSYTIKDIALLSQMIADEPGSADWLLDRLGVEHDATAPEISIALADYVSKML